MIGLLHRLLVSVGRSGSCGLLACILLGLNTNVIADAIAGESVFRQCAGCHAVGPGAANRFGPPLNGVVDNTAGGVADYGYSPAFAKRVDEGLHWSKERLNEFLTAPVAMIPGTKMAYPGLSSETDRYNVIEYLSGLDAEGNQRPTDQGESTGETKADDTSTSQFADNTKASVSEGGTSDSSESDSADSSSAGVKSSILAREAVIPVHGLLHLGRIAMDEEINAWDIDVRPDGAGLPSGSGSVEAGGELYDVQCASCHGVFGEGEGRWPILAGGNNTLTEERPEKTIGSYWPYLSTVFDYVRRAMPFGNARSLSDDDVYALTAYLLYLNDLADESFVLSADNFSSITLPNAGNFIDDTRSEEPWFGKPVDPCMKDCIPGPAMVSQRARVLDVTPDGEQEEDLGGVD